MRDKADAENLAKAAKRRSTAQDLKRGIFGKEFDKRAVIIVKIGGTALEKREGRGFDALFLDLAAFQDRCNRRRFLL